MLRGPRADALSAAQNKCNRCGAKDKLFVYGSNVLCGRCFTSATSEAFGRTPFWGYHLGVNYGPGPEDDSNPVSLASSNDHAVAAALGKSTRIRRLRLLLLETLADDPFPRSLRTIINYLTFVRDGIWLPSEAQKMKEAIPVSRPKPKWIMR